MTTQFLFDGDVVAFVAAAGVQHTYADTAGYIWPFANKAQGEVVVDNIIGGVSRRLAKKLGTEDFEVLVYLTDPEANFRHQIEPSYKSQRKDTVRPLLLSHLKTYLRTKYSAEHWEGMEADDVLGIMATTPGTDRVIVGKDKDFLTLPARYHKLKDDEADGTPIIVEPTIAEANRWHFIQTLAGDRTDGYFGCPGIGMERAARIIDNPVVLKPAPGLITRGPRKGQSTTKWVSEPTDNLWACIVSHYEREGLGEDEALKTARLARILRAEDYDDVTGRITLWEP